jgi:hypothetical protein
MQCPLVLCSALVSSIKKYFFIYIQCDTNYLILLSNELHNEVQSTFTVFISR